jgi:hypothetical protein
MAIVSGGIQLSTDSGQKRIAAQLIMVDEILIAQANPDGPLCDQLLHRMFDESRFSAIDKTAGERIKQIPCFIDFPKKQRTGIGSDRTAVKASDHFPRSESLKMKLIWITLCIHLGPMGNER